MKRLFIAASALFLLTSATNAQSTQQDKAAFEKHQHGGFDHHRGGMTQKLNLTEDQKKEFKQLNESYQKQIAELHANKSISADDLKAKTAALHREHFSKMQSILTAEQKAQMAEQHKQWEEKGPGFGDHGQRGGKMFDQMKTELGLSDDQVAKMKAGRENFHTKMEAIRSNASLNDEQKKEQMKALAKEQHESLKTILTPEQLEKMKAARKIKFSSK